MNRFWTALLLCLCAQAVPAAVVYVKPGGGGSQTGTSWADAYGSLSAAGQAALAGDQIWVAQGTYSERLFLSAYGVSVYGGFLGGETALSQRRDDPALTVIAGTLGNATTVSIASGRLDTLTITGASSGTTLLSTIISTGFGARDLVLERCRISDNSGTALWAQNLNSVVLRRCEFTASRLTAFDFPAVVLTACPSFLMSGCAVAGNQQTSPALGVVSLVNVAGRIENTVFAGNRGAALSLTDGGGFPAPDVQVVACTFTGNPAEIAPGSLMPGLHGCICSATQARTVSIGGRNWLVESAGDPLFVDPALPAGPDGVWFTADDGLRLQAASPCQDWGRMAGAVAAQAVPAYDILGTFRPQNRDAEPGAYEFPTGNAAPLAVAQALATREDAACAITLAASDHDGQALTCRVTALPAGGILSSDAAGLVPVVAEAVLPSTTVYFHPVADDNGAGRGSFAFVANDGLVDSYPATIAIDVLAVNDAPTLGAIADLVIGEDAGSVPVPLAGLGPGATGIAAGAPGDERSQTLTVTAHSSQPSLLPDPAVLRDAVTGEWRLSFAPLADANGSASVSVTVRDDGGTADGGVDTVMRTFSVQVLARNDAPRIDPIPDQTMNEDELLRRVTLTGIRCGPATATDETSQRLTLAVVSSFLSGQVDLAVFPGAQAADGSLSAELWIWPHANAYGSHQAWVVVSDDGGTANGGVDGAVISFLLTIRPQPDAPVLIANDPVPVGSGDSPVTSPQGSDADGNGNFFHILSLPQRGVLLYHGAPVAVGDYVSISGSALVYRRSAADSAEDSFTVALADAGEAFPDQGALTVRLVMPGPQAPVVATTWVGTVQGVAHRLALSASDADSPVLHWTLLSQPAGAALALADDGMLTITPAAGATGESSFQVQVTDGDTAPVTADIALRITGLDAARAHAAGEAPLFVEAGSDLDVTVPFAVDDLGGAAVLSFALAGDPPAGLTVEAAAGATASVRLRWAVPASAAAGWYEVLVLAVDDGGAQPSRTVGCWPLRLGVQPAPAGRN